VKVGDLIRFTEWHYSRPGYEYTKGWIGLIYCVDDSDRSRTRILWTTGKNTSFSGSIGYADMRSYEVFSESR
jgi:hypothetical protein